MRVMLDGAAVRLTDKQLLGVGGEARVFAYRDRALKIFHPPAAQLSIAARRQHEVLATLRRDKIAHFPLGLPAEVIGPQAPILDPSSGELIGYAMRRLEGAHDFHLLGQRRWREGVLSNQELTALFRHLFLTLQTLHRADVIVGDLNDGNVMLTLRGGPRACLIDTDSMQFAGYPCVVAHERFLDPRLYGVDLAARPSFDATSDWYAFSVLLFASLLYVHPYGGVHPSLPTLLRRAEAQVSVLDHAVSRPKAAAAPEILPRALLAHFHETFNRGARGVFPATLLEMSWARCKACGLEHARSRCPRCGATTRSGRALAPAPSSRAATVVCGRCHATPIVHTSGRVLFATVQGKLRYLVQDKGCVLREDGSRVLEQDLAPGMRFAISGASTWVGLGESLVHVARERVVARARTSTFAGGATFDANSSSCFLLDEDALVEATSGRRFGQVLGGQTWLRVGATLGIGFYRAGLLTVTFLFDPRRPGLKVIALPPLEGHLLEASAVFDDEHTLLGLASERAGRRRHTLTLIHRSGQVLGSLGGAPEESPLLHSIAGKALFGGRLLAATEDGLVRVVVDATGRLVEEHRFADTKRFIGAEVGLLPGPGGSLYVVDTQQITQLTLA